MKRKAIATYVGLLRGINVGGHNKVAMSALRDFMSGLGCEAPRSLLQSGNLVFGSRASTSAALERLLEVEAARRLDLHADFLLRTAAQWKTMIDRNPFPAQAKQDPSHLLVFLLKRSPEPERFQALQRAITGPEIVRIVGREAYVVYPVDIGHSRLTSTLIENTLGVRGTGRNWNTALKLDALANAT